jgi:hypothetical protein
MAARKSGFNRGHDQLEEAWRLRLEEALVAYRCATSEYEKLSARQQTNGRLPEPDSPLAQARSAQSDAFLEYTRILGVFSDLVIHGKLPA